VQLNQLKETDQDFSIESAQREFCRLVDEHRHRALWFLKPDLHIDITSTNANSILDHIAEKAPRSTWLFIRRLKRWRSQNFK
jgi:hypothetical protein